MQGRRFDRILTGTAIALVLSLSAPSAWAQNRLRPAGDRGAGADAGACQRAAADRGRCRRPRRRHAPARRAPSTCPIRPTFRRRPSRTSQRLPSRRRRTPHPRRSRRRPPRPLRRPWLPPRRPADPRRAARFRQHQAVAASSTARPTAPRSRPSIPPATTRRSSSAWTARPSAPSRRSTTCATPTPTAWTRPTIRCRRSRPSADPAALAEAEMRLTESVLDYARHAQIGRVHYSRVGGDITYDLVAPQPLDVLSKLAVGQERRRGARQLSAAAAGLQGAAQEARRGARPQGRRGRGAVRARPGARTRDRQEDQADRPDAGRARAAAAREARACRP